MSHPLDIWRGRFGRDLSVNRFFDRFVNEFGDPRTPSAADVFTPGCEVLENKDSYTLKVDLPGIAKNQIKIDLHEGQLTISGERKEEHRDSKKHVTEVSYGSFMRSMTFPVSVDSERVRATHENGVLTIDVPKAAGSKSREVSIS